MNIDWNSILNSALVAVVAAVVPIITAGLIHLISAAVAWFAAKKDESWFMRAGWIVADAVLATSQTLGDELKEAAKDGKFSEEEKARLFSHAKDLAMKNLGQVPGRILPMLESWLRAKIEAELAKLKILQKIGPASLPPAGVPAAAPSPVR